MELPKRKPLRLPNYDYSAPGAYFVTICTHDRRCILSDIAVGADALGGPHVALTETGRIVEKYIRSTDHIMGLTVDEYVIMPNHVHILFRIDGTCFETNNGPPRASAPTTAMIPNAVGAIKRLTQRELGQMIFRRSYHEHAIRNEEDYRQIREYIDANPAKWAEDRYYRENREKRKVKRYGIACGDDRKNIPADDTFSAFADSARAEKRCPPQRQILSNRPRSGHLNSSLFSFPFIFSKNFSPFPLFFRPFHKSFPAGLTSLR